MRLRAERGSVLLLFPAAFLIVLLLGALAIDAAVVFGAQRQLVGAAAAAANDAASLGIDRAELRDGGVMRLDPVAVDRAVRARLGATGVLAHLTEPPAVSVSGDTIEVVLVSRVSSVVSPALPGGRSGRTVTVRATATAVLDD